MIGPKREKLTATQQKAAYGVATIRDDDRCQRCLRPCGPSNRDHRQRRDPFNTVPSNLQILGGSGTTGCHGWKSTHFGEAVTGGWACPDWAWPHEFPAARWLPTSWGTVRKAWVLYDDAGGWAEITDREAAQRRTGDWPGVSKARAA